MIADKTLAVRVTTLWVGIWLCATGAFLSAQSVQLVLAGRIPGAAEMVGAHGDYVYLAADRTLTIFDVSNPASPKRGGAYTFPDKIWGLKVIGSLIYVAADKSGLGILDVSNAQTPKLQGFFKTPGQAKSVAVVGKTALVADHMSGVDFVDLSNPARPASLGSFYLEGYARAVTASGSMAAAVDSPTGLYVFDLSKPAPLEPVGTEQSAERPASVELSDPALSQGLNIAVLVGGGSLQLYDVSKPAAPMKVSTFHTPSGRPQRAALDGKTAYVADSSAGLQVVDLSTPAAPRLVGEYRTAGQALDVAISDSLVFLLVGQTGSSTATGGGETVILKRKP
jgi:hypothetical protein